MIVVDASVVATALAAADAEGDQARDRLRDEQLAAPELLYIEVVSALRGRMRGGKLDVRRAELALINLTEMPLTLASHAPLLARCWELRDNFSLYDATYVALAELFDVILLTKDRRLKNASGPRCRIELLA